ncbi:hypothetical protein [Alloactinosynnema sp. L-07]|nr:hypothetical protein [Alloactinosynnema sp. L-07]
MPMDGRFTIDEAVEKMLGGYTVNPDGFGPIAADAEKEWTAKITKLAVNALLYLCSKTPDIEEILARPGKRKPGKAKTSTGRPAKPPRLIKTGWRLGPNLMRMRAAAAAGDITPGAGKQGPQHRRCHFKIVWCGPGRTEPQSVFVLPYQTHKELLGLDVERIVVPVRAV